VEIFGRAWFAAYMLRSHGKLHGKRGRAGRALQAGEQSEGRQTVVPAVCRSKNEWVSGEIYAIPALVVMLFVTAILCCYYQLPSQSKNCRRG
jgi:hypothetical protein